MPLAQVSEQGQRILDEVERAVVGKRQPLSWSSSAILAGGHVLIEDFPGLGKTLAARSLRARRSGWSSRERSSPPTCCPADLTGSFLYDQREQRVRVPARAAVHRSAARRRDQPHAAQDPVGAARGDAGAPGHGRGRDLPAARARSTCSPPRTPSSTRAPTPCPRPSSTGSCMRVSFGYPDAQTRSGTCCSAGSTRQQARRSLDRVTDAAGLLAMQEAVETVTVDDDRRPVLRASSSTATRDHQHVADGRLAPRVAGPAARVPRRTPCCAAATTSPPRTSRRWRTPVLVAPDHRRPELWMSNVTGRSVVESILATVPTPSAREARPS